MTERIRLPDARRLGTVALVVIALFASGCASFKRDSWQQPDLVIRKLAISPGDKIADLGAGSGYFTFRLAQATGKGGRLYAIDIDPKVLARIFEQAQARAMPQVQTVLGTATDAALPEPVDLVFLCNTYHHIDNRDRYFQELKRYLRPGGRVAIIDLDRLPWFLFPLRNHRTPAATIRTEMGAIGYRLTEEHHELELQNFLVFTPDAQGVGN